MPTNLCNNKMTRRKRKWANGHHEPKKRVRKWKPAGPFRLLDLPRELRDMVYGRILVPVKPDSQVSETPIAYADPPGLKFGENGITHNFLNKPNLLPQVRPLTTTRTAILQTSKQVNEEAREILYESHIFQVDMDEGLWRFDTPAPADEDENTEEARLKVQYEQHYHHDTEYAESALLREAAAASIGWELSSIRRMHLHIDLRGGWSSWCPHRNSKGLAPPHDILHIFNYSGSTR
ncbi:hypothetical protein BU16DRAFT_602334 [Lophium mytilinum]|uniref:Uncharacterized protein n=1 Tax=Lophium mytilinum TaxID=390894 RepID=A0A6A6R7Z1_9PEZI|nr:hypothetical protein BU16DRAFT_602334 [Lophium mytilinum]